MKSSNDLKIPLYPDRKPINNLIKKEISSELPANTIVSSLNKDTKLSFAFYKCPVINGFYAAHANHLPIRLKPDDIWLLIVQAFSTYVNNNSERLRDKFVNYF